MPRVGHGRKWPGISADRAADIIWTVCGQANYDALVLARGWSPDDLRDWIAETLIGALLPDPSGG